MSRSAICVVVACIGLGLAACDDAPAPPAPTTVSTAVREGPPHARWSIVDELRRDAEAVRHASDGGGRAWIDPATEPVGYAGKPGRWTIVYEVGPEGVALGGAILFQVSPFWGWSTPQTENPDAFGFTRVSTSAQGVVLDADTLDRQLLGLRVAGRALAAGEQVRIEYGAGSRGALADRYAERASRFWIRVDGDGDGTSGLLRDSPTVAILPGAPARLVLTLPTVVRPGETARLCVAVLDAVGNTDVEVEGEVALEASAAGLGLPERVSLAVSDGGRTSVPFSVRSAPADGGTVHVRGRLEHAGRVIEAESNPLVVTAHGPRVFWGDLHGHSGLSDGTGTPEDYFVYARDVAALDLVSLTDHDHWGMLPLVSSPDDWERIRRATLAVHEPGRFVTLLGYEWTSWIHGHRHVLWFGEHGTVRDSVDERFDDPRELWDALRGEPALTIAHHSAGGPVPTNWEIPPDPELEPVTEVVSSHGVSEAFDVPLRIYAPIEGNTVRDALDKGYRLGFVGSGDGHDGHPGLTDLSPDYPTGGLAAIVADDLTRDAVLAALRARRVYATSGPRIFVRCALSGHPMGSVLSAAELGGAGELYARAIGTAPIARVDLIRSGRVIDSLPGSGEREVELSATLGELAPGEYVYVRVIQEEVAGARGGGMAWTSPFFFE